MTKFPAFLSLCFGLVAMPAFSAEQAPPIEGVGTLIELNEKLIGMVENAKDATVSLTSLGARGAGSGVIVSEDGLILTAAHVMGSLGDDVIVIMPDGTRLAGERLGADFDHDAAMIRIKDKGAYPHVELGDSDALRVNDWCVALGHPGGFDPRRTAPVRLGRVLRPSDSERFLMTDCALISGDSGGPLFDVEGRLIGIHSNIGVTLSENRHVPISVFQKQWDAMAKGVRTGSRFASGEAEIDAIPHAPKATPQGADAKASDAKPNAGGENAALSRYLDGLLKDGKKNINLELTPEQIEEFGGMAEIMKHLKQRIAAKSNGGESPAGAADMGDAGLAEVKPPTMEELVKRIVRNDGNLDLTPEEVVALGDLNAVNQRLAAMVAALDEEQIAEMMKPDAQAQPDRFLKSLQDALTTVVKLHGNSTADVRIGDTSVALGTIVNKEGWMLTKSTETLEGEIRVAYRGKDRAARLLKRFPEWDLAVYDLDGNDFEPVEWAAGPQNKERLASALTTPGPATNPLGIGVVSVLPRPMGKTGFLGIITSDVGEALKVERLAPRSSADTAGLRPGDLILKVGGEKPQGSVLFASYLLGLQVGDVIPLDLMRDGEPMEVNVTLADFPPLPKGTRKRGGSSQTSEKIDGFPRVLQHDIALTPAQCGGPLLDLQGRCVGINVSRAGRVNTYAAPADDVISLLEGIDESSVIEKHPDAAQDEPRK